MFRVGCEDLSTQWAFRHEKSEVENLRRLGFGADLPLRSTREEAKEVPLVERPGAQPFTLLSGAHFVYELGRTEGQVEVLLLDTFGHWVRGYLPESSLDGEVGGGGLGLMGMGGLSARTQPPPPAHRCPSPVSLRPTPSAQSPVVAVVAPEGALHHARKLENGWLEIDAQALRRMAPHFYLHQGQRLYAPPEVSQCAVAASEK